MTENADSILNADCHEINQYLNTSSPYQMSHTCAACPLGASCEGTDITWSKVNSTYGWWRLLQYNDQNIFSSNIIISKFGSLE